MINYDMPDWASDSGEDQYGIWANLDFSNEVIQRFRKIPAGKYVMGSPFYEIGRELPKWGRETEHDVEIAYDFWLAETACTQMLWEAVMGDNPSSFLHSGNPVEMVDWEDIQNFMNRIGTKYKKVVESGYSFRLPSEAEWEYSARANTDTTFWFGARISPEQANFDGSKPYQLGARGENRACTIPVKELQENAFGLFQILGNVWEWCADAYVKDLGHEAAVNPYIRGEQGSARSVRGGSWSCPGHGARAAFRSYDHPTDRYNNLGFRIAFGPDLNKLNQTQGN